MQLPLSFKYCCCLLLPAGAFSRVDTKATTARQLQLPVSLVLLRTSPSLGRTDGCFPLVPITRMTAEQMRSKGLVMQIMPDCMDRGVQTDPNIWEWLLVRAHSWQQPDL
jgi:hypothetical protein